MPSSVRELFEKRKMSFSIQVKNTQKKLFYISNARLTFFLLATIIPGFLVIEGYFNLAFYSFLLGSFFFSSFFLWHQKINYKKKILDSLILTNDYQIARLDNNWEKLTNGDGANWLNIDHPYANDLDIVGHKSLFHWINNSSTAMGQERLASWLLGDYSNLIDRVTSKLKQDDLNNWHFNLPTEVDHFEKRQEAVKELSKKIDWCQNFFALSHAQDSLHEKPNILIDWISDKPIFLPFSVTIGRLWMFLSLSLLLLSYWLWPLGWIAFMSLSVQCIVAFYVSSIYKSSLEKSQTARGIFISYVELFKHIKKVSFLSPLLLNYQEILFPKGQYCAENAFRDLNRIMNFLQVRRSFLFIVLNPIFLWDFQVLHHLEKWRLQHKNQVMNWLETISCIDALISLSMLASNYPKWQYAKWKSTSSQENYDNFEITFSEVGHPLLNDQERKSNNFSFSNQNKVSIISGSNMAGKSTFLRSVGINLILAYTGAPVCAQKCLFTNPLIIFSSMRIKDDLNQHQSSFYAELIRLKKLLQYTRKKEPMLVLLDEIFRGTNSKDRLEATKVVLKYLLKPHIFSFITTHDLALTDLGNNYKNIHNYHFTESYQDQKLIFDYQIRDGIAKSSNGLALLEMVGIKNIG